MKLYLLLILMAVCQMTSGQQSGHSPLFNTAKSETYLLESEKEMIAEINYLRNQPREYAKLLYPLLEKAKKDVENGHKSSYGFSYTKYYKTVNGESVLDRVDTIHYDESQDELDALTELISRLEEMEPLRILKPDKGIYKALRGHEKDQSPTGNIDHFGRDKSWPNDRILKYSPLMTSGGENIACGKTSVRDIVIMLAIDSGISGRGHRETLLDPSWTHVSCRFVGELEKGLPCNWWIQNFGAKEGR